jgi:hypothetical protein
VRGVAVRMTMVMLAILHFDARRREHFCQAHLCEPLARNIAEGESRARRHKFSRQWMVDELARGKSGRSAPDLETVLEDDFEQLEARPFASGQLQRNARQGKEARLVGCLAEAGDEGVLDGVVLRVIHRRLLRI